MYGIRVSLNVIIFMLHFVKIVQLFMLHFVKIVQLFMLHFVKIVIYVTFRENRSTA